MIADAVARLRHDANVPVDPRRRGPVPLNRFFEELNLAHAALPGLTVGGVADSLRAAGVPVEGMREPATKLAGFLFVAGRVGKAFVCADDILARRRFAAVLLMPACVIRARAEELKRELRIARCPRDVLEYRLAAELLVGAQAIRYRLAALGVGDD